MKKILLISIFVFMMLHQSAISKELPRFMSLKSSEVNMRVGPKSSYPIAWTYQRKGYPMKVIAEFDNWRKLKDKNGDTAWAHINMLTRVRNAVISGNKYHAKIPSALQQKKELLVFRYPDEQSYPMFRAEFGLVVKLRSCNKNWCKVAFEKDSGWVRKENLWGVEPDEVF